MVRDLVLRFASRLRFPVLFFLVAGIFVLDLIVPDFVPFADELLLGLLTVLFGTWERQRSEATDPGKPERARPTKPPVDSDAPIIDIDAEEMKDSGP